ncbi:hypothetical protein, partial [Lactiplantibacillus plantarum]|uniref:hypothetical protein n=1 Tax=Lactiplantibacillus plantarum TaxID=1590 RepID=UPI001C9E6454
DQMAKLWPLYPNKKLVQLVQRSNNFSEKQMLFIDKRNKIAPNIYIIDIRGYSFNVFEGRFVKNTSLAKPMCALCGCMLARNCN